MIKERHIRLINKNFPPELIERLQWVCWKHKDGRKPPLNPLTGKLADVNDSATWASFKAASNAYLPNACDGLGFVLAKQFEQGADLVGIDFDDCVCGGLIEDDVLFWIKRLDSYTEYSPSGKGIHIFVRGCLPMEGRKSSKIEMYSDRRFFTVTGDRVSLTSGTIRWAQREIFALHRQAFPLAHLSETCTPANRPNRDTIDSDQDLMMKMFNSRSGAKIHALWHGDLSGHGGDWSRADLALVRHLTYWTRDNPEWVDRLFRQSKLMRPKWDEGRGDLTYGQRTIKRVFGWAGGEK